MFHFSTYHPNSCNFIPSHAISPHEGIDRCDRCIGRRNNTATWFFLINNTFSIMSKLFTPNIYWWSRKIPVIILDASQTKWHLR